MKIFFRGKEARGMALKLTPPCGECFKKGGEERGEQENTQLLH